MKIQFNDPRFKTRIELPQNLMVTGSPRMVESINKIFGSSVVRLPVRLTFRQYNDMVRSGPSSYYI